MTDAELVAEHKKREPVTGRPRLAAADAITLCIWREYARKWLGECGVEVGWWWHGGSRRYAGWRLVRAQWERIALGKTLDETNWTVIDMETAAHSRLREVRPGAWDGAKPQEHGT